MCASSRHLALITHRTFLDAALTRNSWSSPKSCSGHRATVI